MDASALAYDAKGLVTVVVQDRLTGEVRMLAHANEDAIRATMTSGEGHFWSRSRGAPWKKGETSGHVLRVHEVWADCDRDAVVYLVDPEGPSCHTGAQSCFFERAMGGVEGRALPMLVRLEDALEARANSSAEKSYTKSLLEKGAPKIVAKIREEADELSRAIESESDERVVSEAADVLYHVMVGLLHRRVPLRAVLAELAKRFGTSGHDEKASRTGSA
ncbi:bifunctional phosphoribosyl-AMP cyclohydrolase/phosphoribosyl-ATP diphosphatase HisIE [Sandaracinus amylolyticus]|uniref:Histidine biosynthesis bifunctional protein HisIE n=1 Tax=Sandaracinus amylolyticus TaxID=927083 RepID=A0A0F6W5Z8_9BACT|nr:bifunctional phosphoribosyl-AMP cyclohydrolase/phosphoribosyl-ATP diphosphatase HisIE [Sandaracinus amylolyticus]AKF08146.1 Phosphoribosyl-AMP cyclohydrolase [Sandaracinus amylolyticus]